eukprot:13964194-Alexandrium_andersonii.AAC.1
MYVQARACWNIAARVEGACSHMYVAFHTRCTGTRWHVYLLRHACIRRLGGPIAQPHFLGRPVADASMVK